jgi:hypothetical protein
MAIDPHSLCVHRNWTVPASHHSFLSTSLFLYFRSLLFENYNSVPRLQGEVWFSAYTSTRP